MALTFDDRMPDCIWVYDMDHDLVLLYDVKQGNLGYRGNVEFSPYPTRRLVQYDVNEAREYYFQRFGYVPNRYRAINSTYRHGTKSYLVDQGCVSNWAPKMDCMLNPVQLRTLLSLASRQVKGGEILKGLKALGMDVKGITLQQNYLGGWVIKLYGQDVSVGELLRRF